mgnify:CR=1 FL=1
MSDFTWMLSPEGICSGGNGASLTVEDMALLHNGHICCDTDLFLLSNVIRSPLLYRTSLICMFGEFRLIPGTLSCRCFLLHLNHGRWDGQQLLEEDWIRRSLGVGHKIFFKYNRYSADSIYFLYRNKLISLAQWTYML